VRSNGTDPDRDCNANPNPDGDGNCLSHRDSDCN
jgi:hypothetical protein